MPLKLHIKPEGKLFINGNGYIKNVGHSTMTVIVSETLAVERPKRAVEALKKDMQCPE